MVSPKNQRHWVSWIVTGARVGYLPLAPGTWGTLLGIVLIIPVMPFPLVHGVIALVTLFFAVWWIDLYMSQLPSGAPDPREVVVDEIIGVWIALFLLPITFFSIAFAFFLFRILDILKPFPISYFDQKVKGGVGIVMDDVMAGLISNAILHVIFYFFESSIYSTLFF